MRQLPGASGLKRQRLQQMLWGGFGAILLLLAANWAAQLSQVNKFFDLIQQSRVASDKMEIITSLVEVARARTRMTAQMIAVDDPFEKDALKIRLDEQAAQFVVLRDRLIEIGLTEQERLLLENTGSYVRPALLAQRQAAEMAISEDPLTLREANRLMMLEVFPLQGKIIDSFMTLFQRQRQIIQNNTEQAQTHFRYVVFLISSLAGGTLVVAVMVAVLVIRKTAATERELHREKERAQVTLGSIGDAVISTDALGRVQYMNPVAEKLVSCTATQAFNRPIGKIFPAFEERGGRRMSQVVHSLGQYGNPQPPGDDVVLQVPGQEEQHIALTIAPIREMSGRVEGVILTFHDVTEARQLAKRVAFQAQHDALTGLLNRRAFQERVEQALALYPEGQHVFCAMDLDRFKAVNDLGGHAAGDAMLRKLTTVIRSVVRQGDLVARMGGDEFALFLINTNMEAAAGIAGKLVQAVGDYRLLWEGQRYHVGVSIGLAETPRDGAVEYQRLMQAADAGCYSAKHGGRNQFAVAPYGDGSAEREDEKARIMTRLIQALDNDELVLLRQPMRALQAKHKPHCAEVLLRLPDGPRSLLLPEAFLPLAERHGLMPRIDLWVLNQALLNLTTQGGDLCLSVNLATQSLVDADFASTAVRMIEASDVDPTRLCFEIQESAAISQPEAVKRAATRLADAGCRMALDHFSSGLGCFSAVSRLPLHQIKLAGDLVKRITADATARAMVAAMQDVARTLNIQVVAVWVEDEQVLQMLQELGVDWGQGFHLGVPEPLTADWALHRAT